MRKLSGIKSGGLLLLLVGAGAVAHYALPGDALGKLGQVGSLPSAGAGQPRSSSQSALEAVQLKTPAQGNPTASGTPRVFSPTTPLVGQPKSANDSVRLAQLPPRDGDTVRRASTGFAAPLSVEGSRRLASSKPTDDDARRELTRDLQTELKRVGCFDGDINGTWSPASKKAMSAFMDRVNATLPVEDPDYILLTLVQGHSAQACGKGCPPGQGLSNDGRCQPRSILAQSARRSDDRKSADRNEKRPATDSSIGNQKTAEIGSVQTGSISRPTVSASGTASGAWTTSTTASIEPSKPQLPKAPTLAPVLVPVPMAQIIMPPAPAASPLPGRMAMGAPVPSPDETAKLDDIEARKRRAQAALIDEQKLQAKAQVEADRIKAERIAAEAQRREQQLQALAEAERKKNDQFNSEADRRDKQVAAADARRSAQRQAEALEASATNNGSADAKSDDVKISDGAKLAAVAGAALIAQEANERRTLARRARDARERDQERTERERERRVAAAVPPPQVYVRRPAPVSTYRPTVVRAAPSPRPAAEQRWTRTIFDTNRSR